VKRLVAQELTLSFVPDAEQRLWRTVMRRKYQITRSRVQLHNRLEALLEEAHIKISSVVSDLLGTSAAGSVSPSTTACSMRRGGRQFSGWPSCQETTRRMTLWSDLNPQR
jgi:hypothetical protein